MRQTEYPGKELLPEVTLHRRREATFLVLAALVVTATAALVAGSSVMIDMQTALAQIARGVELPTQLVVPVGALVSAVGILALLLACELYGRRAGGLVWTALFASGVLAGLAYLAGLVDRADASFSLALPLATCAVAGALATVVVYAALRRMAPRALIVRAIVATAFGQAAGWAAFAGVAHAIGDRPTVDFLLAVALGSSAFALACVIVLAPVFAIAANTLSLFLRVPRATAAGDDDDDDAYVSGPMPRLQEALVVDEEDVDVEPRPYSSMEMRFFTEGDDTSLLAE
jgi:hypothetical protein